MLNIAITGTFSSGKTFILEAINSMEYKVFSSDKYVCELYSNIEFQNYLKNRFGELLNQKYTNISNSDDYRNFINNQFDTKLLAKMIYYDDNARKLLEFIIHPMVLSGIKEFEYNNSDDVFVFSEVPLLFECNFEKYFAYSICVVCSEHTRYLRSKSRNICNKNVDFYDKINKIQMTQNEKSSKADFTINSEDNLSVIRNSLNEILSAIWKLEK